MNVQMSGNLLIHLSQTVSEHLGTFRQWMLGGKLRMQSPFLWYRSHCYVQGTYEQLFFSEHNRHLRLGLEKTWAYQEILICRIVLTHSNGTSVYATFWQASLLDSFYFFPIIYISLPVFHSTFPYYLTVPSRSCFLQYLPLIPAISFTAKLNLISGFCSMRGNWHYLQGGVRNVYSLLLSLLFSFYSF